MSLKQVTIVRIYLKESDHGIKRLLTCLHDELKVGGVTVFRGIEGYGQSGKVLGSSLVDLSLDLPLVVEFFESPERAQAAVDRVKEIITPGHLVFWPVTVEQ